MGINFESYWLRQRPEIVTITIKSEGLAFEYFLQYFSGNMLQLPNLVVCLGFMQDEIFFDLG